MRVEGRASAGRENLAGNGETRWDVSRMAALPPLTDERLAKCREEVSRMAEICELRMDPAIALAPIRVPGFTPEEIRQRRRVRRYILIH